MEQMISWFEIPCIDIQRAANFYSEIFEKTLEITDFQGIDTAFFPTGGALVKEDSKPSKDGIIIYLNGGDDLSNILNRIEPAGGKVLVPKRQISEKIGYYALFLDTEGNRLGLFSKN